MEEDWEIEEEISASDDMVMERDPQQGLFAIASHWDDDDDDDDDVLDSIAATQGPERRRQSPKRPRDGDATSPVVAPTPKQRVTTASLANRATPTQDAMIHLQRYINQRAIETVKPLRDFISDLTGIMALGDSSIFYRDGKQPTELWLIRNFKGNQDEFSVIRHNAAHLSKELLLLWMREWWRDNAPNNVQKKNGDDTAFRGSDRIDRLRAKLIGANDGNRPSGGWGSGSRRDIFQQARDMQRVLGPGVVPSARDIIDTPPWHFNLLNYDLVKDMILSDVGKGALRIALEALQAFMPMSATRWTVPMILVSPGVRVWFAWWAKILLTHSNANGYPGRVYIRSGGTTSPSTMALNISSGVTYLKIQSTLLRGFRKVFSCVLMRTHPRVTQQEHEIAQLEVAHSRTTLPAKQNRLSARLADARRQLQELRIRLPGQLVMLGQTRMRRESFLV